jgi:predicted DCC family thiol-disulfide oxidoreductase YuxK
MGLVGRLGEVRGEVAGWWELGLIAPVAEDSNQPYPVLLFDGECGLCQGLVGQVLRRDSSRAIRVAALQGITGQRLLRGAGLPTDDFDSLVFFPNAAGLGHHVRTDGVIAVLQHLSPTWARVGRVLGWVPARWRDGGYRLVARSRHRIFGEPKGGGLSQPEWADRVLP